MSTKVNRLIDNIHNTSARELSHDKHQLNLYKNDKYGNVNEMP